MYSADPKSIPAQRAMVARPNSDIPESGHWVAEETPEQLLVALTPFLAPYRNAAAG
jgi:hypothetical protein